MHRNTQVEQLHVKAEQYM